MSLQLFDCIKSSVVRVVSAIIFAVDTKQRPKNACGAYVTFFAHIFIPFAHEQLLRICIAHVIVLATLCMAKMCRKMNSNGIQC